MIKNYLKVAVRSLIKQRVYTSINVIGLSVGVASCMLISLFVIDELSYDTFHANASNIYKLALERKYPNHITNYAIVPHSYGDVMVRDYPEVSSVVKVGGPNRGLVTYTNSQNDVKQFEEEFILAADSNFFDVFSIKLLKGEPNNVLLKLTDVVISEKTAERYFGTEDPIGKTLRMFDRDFNVTGVSENVPENSHFRFDILGKWSDEIFAGGVRANFITFTAHLYIELKEGANPRALEAKFPKMVDTYASAQIEADLGKSWEEYKKEGNGYRYFLQPLTSIHLDPTNMEGKMRPGGNINYVYFLISIAVLILIIACINFMNLATARSAERAREVGVRKTMGSLKGQLIYQFLVESILLSLVATFIAVCIAQLVMPAFNNLSGKELSIPYSGAFIGSVIGIAAFVGFLAGSYPAFALSSIHPILVMKGNFTGSAKGAWLRNGLVVFQFFISITLIVGTLTVSRQMRFMQSKSLGYDKEQVLVVERAFGLREKTQTFIDEVKQINGVESAASSYSLLGRQEDFFGNQFTSPGSSEILTSKSMIMDDEFAQTIGFEFISGHGYSRDTNDSLSIILNETAVNTMGIEDPIGKKLNQVQRGPNGVVQVSYTIIGVIKDFNFQTLRDVITPLTIMSNESFGGGGGYVIARIKGAELSNVLVSVEQKWKMMMPEQPFNYLFLDEDLNAHYDAEKRAGQVFAVFSILAIVIACVGLFGLSAYTASLRTKEIGVRKVLGATVGSVVVLLSKDFSKLILIAFAFAVPASWYLMDNWLDGFAYHIDIGIGVFILAGGSALLISWLTVSYQSIKAAIMNPVKSLRSQ